jgi:hypothetical protein
MKKMTLSTLTVLALSATSASAMSLYQDAQGNVFTKAGQGRTLIGDFTPGNDVTIMKKKSNDYLLGKETAINMKIVPQDNKNMWLKMGIRLQGTFEDKRTTQAGVETSNQDAYLRRTRLEVQAGFSKTASFVMDIRNDKVNIEDKGEQTFNVGDAYLKIKKPFGTSAINFKLYRAKIDISRTETVKSARVIAYDRPKVADEAAQYITHNRRGTNAQMYGHLFNKKIWYQVAAGDATYSGKFSDAQGNDLKGDGVAAVSGDAISRQSFFHGGKIKISPFTGWEEGTVTETYMGKGKHFTIGGSYWRVPNIVTDNNVNLERELINAEVSAHYKSLFVQAEYFKFNDVIEDVTNATALTLGKSSGYYVTGEYVMPDLGYTAPFFRYENWDKFEGKAGYDFRSRIYGVNWYLRGNTTKFGVIVQNDDYDSQIGNKKVESYRVTTQWFF